MPAEIANAQTSTILCDYIWQTDALCVILHLVNHVLVKSQPSLVITSLLRALISRRRSCELPALDPNFRICFLLCQR